MYLALIKSYSKVTSEWKESDYYNIMLKFPLVNLILESGIKSILSIER